MEIRSTTLADVMMIVPRRHRDERGFFSEVFRQDFLAAHGIDVAFVQDNHSLSVAPGVIRGLHFQLPPFAQAKLVRVIAGAILDVAVDLRRFSPDFGRHVALRLDAATGNQLYIPEGFAHGFCTLEPNTEIVYKASRYYSAAHDRGLLWNDPALDIAWPRLAAPPILSEKDRANPPLAALPPCFDYARAGGAR